MNALSFKISGKFAHFKKPDVNSFAYFTYNNIPKPTLLGMLGAILGYGGYTQLSQLKKSKTFQNPEFYEKLKDLKVSIIPLAKNGYFEKKIQTFNNSVGYASFEQGGNLIIREQWLENPKWQILILDDNSSEFNLLKEYLFNKKTKFIPYLGKNDHFANISDVKEIELSHINESLVCRSLVNENLVTIISKGRKKSMMFYHKEFLPIGFKNESLVYELIPMILTSDKIEINDEKMVFKLENNSVWFY